MKRLVQLSWGLLGLWLTLSLWHLVMGQADLFQRAGAFGVMAIVVMFSALQLRVLDVRDAVEGTKAPASQMTDRQSRLNAIEAQGIAMHGLVACVATIQWGYGDLAINRAVVCGEWTC